MKKKVISMLLVSAMAVTLIAGCGNNGADEKKSEGDGKTLEVWVAPLDSVARVRTGETGSAAI